MKIILYCMKYLFFGLSIRSVQIFSVRNTQINIDTLIVTQAQLQLSLKLSQ